MRNNLSAVNKYRIRTGRAASSDADGPNGVFIVPCGRVRLFVIASDGKGWEHVSVSPYSKPRVPTWDEMCFVKDLFWRPDEWVVQFHPAESEYVNNHPYVLHMWRPTEQELPTPPSILTGIKGAKVLAANPSIGAVMIKMPKGEK
jgi:hypothetical protein